jgi:hypothetical protein
MTLTSTPRHRRQQGALRRNPGGDGGGGAAASGRPRVLPDRRFAVQLNRFIYQVFYRIQLAAFLKWQSDVTPG